MSGVWARERALAYVSGRRCEVGSSARPAGPVEEARPRERGSDRRPARSLRRGANPRLPPRPAHANFVHAPHLRATGALPGVWDGVTGRTARPPARRTVPSGRRPSGRAGGLAGGTAGPRSSPSNRSAPSGPGAVKPTETARDGASRGVRGRSRGRRPGSSRRPGHTSMREAPGEVRGARGAGEPGPGCLQRPPPPPAPTGTHR